MRHSTTKNALAGLTIFLGLSGSALLARTQPATMEDQVRHQLVMLPYIGVFDNLGYSVDGDVVTLRGQVVRPVDKVSAENVVKSIPGVARVDDQIEVLPLSPFDDRVRIATLRALLRANPLNRYFYGPRPDMRIIVKNGNVTLEGEVLNEADRDHANIVVHTVPDVFSVTNNLRIHE
jgi:hyperosmotically inducible periplasmic protein